MAMHQKRSVARAFAATVLAVLLYAAGVNAEVSLDTMVTFDETNGYRPQAGLVQGRDGNFYGTLSYGGWHDLGVVFKMAPDGKCVILVTFDGANGSHPSGLVLGNDGNFYGTTLEGGKEGSGSVFRMTPAGAVTTITSFSAYVTGWSPLGFIRGQDGMLYGVTHDGGPNDCGTVFMVSPNGTLTTLLAFNKNNGSHPSGGLIQDKEGSLYGTTSQGRPGMNGSSFKLALNGQLTVPAAILGNNNVPLNLLVRSTNGNLYGTATGTGPTFKLNRDGVLTGAAWLLKAKDGYFYGTTYSGSGNGSRFGLGTVYKMDRDGVLTTLALFKGTNGAYPLSGLVQGTNGNIYGITMSGGAFNQGTIFRLNLANTLMGESASPASVNTPSLIHPVSNNVDPRLLDLMQAPIEFYGKVVDEKSNAIAGASVSFSWVDLLARNTEGKATTQTDSEGLFSLRDKHGASMTVSVGKNGYYSSRNSQQTFWFSKMDPERKYVPNPKKPVVFALRKKGQRESLIKQDFPPGIGQRWQLRHDGTPVELDLIKGQKVSNDNGQVKLEFWRDITNRNAQKFNWKLRLSVPKGGLIPTDEEFPFQAPLNGYQPSIEINMPTTNQPWQSDVRSNYYVKLPNGNYGRLDFYLLPYNGVFTVHSFINPSGSGNLEAQ